MAHADLLVRSSPPPHVHEKRLGEARYWVVVVVMGVFGYWRFAVGAGMIPNTTTPILSLDPDS